MHILAAISIAVLSAAASQDSSDAEEALAGEALPRAALGPGVVETMEQVLARVRERAGDVAGIVGKERNGASGAWVVPSRRGTYRPYSGEHYATNEWGDTRMGIGFADAVRLRGAWIAGQASPGAWADGMRVIGYREGAEVARTPWFEDIGESPAWFAMDLDAVDRIEIVARPVLDGAGWYALDDLTFERPPAAPDLEPELVVVDFDDLAWRTRLTGTDYAGLSWEVGQGDFEQDVRAIHAPVVPRGQREGVGPGSESPGPSGPGTLPSIVSEFFGMRMFENGTSFIPPDTCGAAGPGHFVSVVNVKLGVFDKATGARLFEAPLTDFFGVTGLGDPRVTYDHFSGRYFLLCSSGPSTARIYLAISMTGDPTGAWFKSYIETAQGADIGRWPDYPTLGFDANGFYTAALMVPSTMTIWAIDKAPLLTGTPGLGTVTAWRDRQFEGAIQPCVTYGDSGGELLVSRRNATRMRIRKISGPLTAPTLSTVAGVDVPANSAPPEAPALGSSTDLGTGDTRPMNAVYRDGSVYSAHTINVDGRASCRWYELAVASATAPQIGTIADPVRSYYYPSISVSSEHHVVLGFSGSHAGEYAGAFYTGHHALDPPGATAAPALLRPGAGPYNHLDGNGTNRWGDYSLTSIDPVDDTTFWTIQEYARPNNRWGTWVAQVAFLDPCPATMTRYCTPAVPNSTGSSGLMEVTGSLVVAEDDLTLTAASLPTNSNIGYFVMGQGTNSFVPPGSAGPICVTPGLLRYLPPVSNTNELPGGFSRAVGTSGPISGNITAGSTWNFQAWHRDSLAGTSNLTDAVSVEFCP